MGKTFAECGLVLPILLVLLRAVADFGLDGFPLHHGARAGGQGPPLRPRHQRLVMPPARGHDSRRESRARGQALVEMALVLPLLILLIAGLLQFGVLLSGQVAVVNAVREAARFGSVLETMDAGQASANGPQVKAHLLTVMDGGVPGYSPGNVAVSSACYIGYENPGSSPTTYSVRLTVSVGYSHPLFVPVIAQLLDGIDGAFDGVLRLGASERFRVENFPLTGNQLASEVCT